MKFFLFLIIVIFPMYLSAQTEYYTNSVSQLKAEVRNNFIRLVWTDSREANGTVYIYRSARPFMGVIPANIRPVPVQYGTRYYIDDIEDMENLYYFIAASDSSGRRFDTIIPGVNSISVRTGETVTSEISEEEKSIQEGNLRPSVEFQAAEVIPAAARGITNLKAVKENDRIIITFNINGPNKNVVLYRSMLPVANIQDLMNAIVVQTGVTSPYVDFPVPGIKWHYTAVFEDEISGGNITLRSGQNSTSQAVIINGAESAQTALRPIPLPFLSVNNKILGSGGTSEIIDAVPLKDDIEKALNSVEKTPKPPFIKKTPRVFKVDIDSPLDGQESLLNKIVHDYFIRQNWENTRIALINFISQPRTKELQTRARFYLGQSFYFTDRYREALFEFLSVQALYATEANIWIESVLSAMVH